MISSERVKKEELRLQRAVSATQNGVMITAATEPDDPIVYVNRAFERITGYSSKEVIGRNPRFLQAGDNDQPTLHELRAVRKASVNGDMEWKGTLRNYRNDGELFYNEFSTAAVRDEEGCVTHHIGVISDVTKRERAEEKVRFQARLLDAVGQAVIAVDLSGRIVYWNRAAEKVYGWSTAEAVGRLMGEIMVPKDELGLAKEIWAEISAGKSWSGEFVVKRRDGTTFPAMVTDTPVFDERGNLVSIIGVSTDLTERKRTEEALSKSNELLRSVMEGTPDAVFVKDLQGRYLVINRAGAEDLGKSVEEVVGKTDAEIFASGDGRRIMEADREILASGETHTVEDTKTTSGGETRTYLVTKGPYRNHLGEVSGVFGVSRDITGRKRAEEALRRSEERFRSLVQNASDVVTILGADGTIIYQSPAVERLLGYRPEEMVGESAFSYVHPDDRELVFARFTEGIRSFGTTFAPLEYRFRHKDGSWRYLEGMGTNLLSNPKVHGVVINSRDVTERKALEVRLEHQAFHDSLTGLANRALFTDRLGHALDRAGRSRGCVAVLFMDLDDFKLVNDSLGHEVGDELLVRVAERLSGTLRLGDTAARLGGDEFVLLLEDLAGEDEALRVAERVKEALRHPFALEGRELFVTVSVGIAFNASGRKQNPGDLLREADVAMYAAKRGGKDRFEAFEGAMDAPVLKRLEAQADLRRALEHGELTLCYQPKVDLRSGKIACFEALARWDHPERGTISPVEFISLAEETGLIVQIGRRVLGEACRQAKEWQALRPNGPPLTLSVNLSARQFEHEDLVHDVAWALEETGLPAGYLILEITESAVMEDAPRTVRITSALKALGVKLSIDDFGTGYSSLSYLRRFPTDYLKIDRSFVEGLGEAPEDAVVASGILSLAHAMGLEVVAEGVETGWQLAKLREMGCDMAQGYLFAEPLPAEAAAKLLASDPRW